MVTKQEWMGSKSTLLAAVGALLICLALISMLWPAGEPQVLEDWIGQPAPDMTLLDLDGKPQTLSEMRGKRVFLVFWSTSCIPCIEEIPALVRLRDTVPHDSLVILALTGDDETFLKQSRVVTKMALNYPVIPFIKQIDKLIRPYREINGLPFLMVIGPDGRFEDISVGAKDYTELMELAQGGSSF